MSLCQWLQILASDATSRMDRERAASHLYQELRHFAPGVVRRRFYRASDDLIDEAIQKVVLKASLGRARFRGDDDRAARAWCSRILQRYVLDVIRRERRLVDLDDAPQQRAPATPDPLAGQDMETLLDRLEGALARLHRERDLEMVRHNLRVHLEARIVGTDIDAQIARWAAPDDPDDKVALRRARDRIYQYRRRGKVAGCEAVQALLETGEITPAEADLLVRLVGCEEDES